MTTRLTPGMRRAIEVTVVVASALLGLLCAVLGALKVTYLQHGPHYAMESAASITFSFWVFVFGLIGLLGGIVVGVNARAQLWPAENERGN
jgi:hypothetical protein